MEAIEKLVAIEAIRKTKATYWYTLDMKDWEGFANVFTADAVIDLREEVAFSEGRWLADLPPVEEAIAAGDMAVTVGGREFAMWVKSGLDSWKTVHHGHAPIIDIESADEGRAIWPLFDYIDNGTRALQAYGHYHESYRRQADGRWLIHAMRLTRLRGDGEHPLAGA